MEQSQIINDERIKIKVSELIRKFKSKQDIFDYLISQLIASLDAETYAKLYATYKYKETSKSYKKWNDYEVSLPENTVKAISSFKPVNR